MEKLNCKSLMIGDWVYRPDCYDQVKEIRNNGVIGIDGMRGLITFSELEPIPITTEILEKNGFKEDGYGVYGDSDSYFIPTYQSGFDIESWETHIEPTEGIGDFSGNLKYIHQLQHALKVCGIEKEIIL